MSTTKEITESLGFGIIFASIKAAIDYASGKKVTVYSAGKNTVIFAFEQLGDQFEEEMG